MSIHLVMYSNKEPFDTTKRMMKETLHKFTKRPVIIHDYTLDSIKECEWFHHIETISEVREIRKRDGSHCAWKPYIIRDVYNVMGDNDILFYADCSRYFTSGFKEPLDELFNSVDLYGHMAGCVADNVLNNTTCENIDVWNTILPNEDNTLHLRKKHICASWLLMKKNTLMTAFINDWAFFVSHSNEQLRQPLITYHHTVDQSILNILACKYNLVVFYDPELSHHRTKYINRVLKTINCHHDKCFLRYDSL